MGRIAGLWAHDSTQNWHRSLGASDERCLASETSALNDISSTLSGKQAQEGRVRYSKSGHK
jgi:hypothetical protein